jgi:hypothetical protein
VVLVLAQRAAKFLERLRLFQGRCQRGNVLGNSLLLDTHLTQKQFRPLMRVTNKNVAENTLLPRREAASAIEPLLFVSAQLVSTSRNRLLSASVGDGLPFISASIFFSRPHSLKLIER